MRHIAAILTITLLFPAFVTGKTIKSSENERPVWVNGFFTERNNSYVEMVSAVGFSEDNARQKAAQIIVERRSLATGQQASISIVDGDIHIEGSDVLTVKARIIDQYTERTATGEYRVSLLVQTAKNPEFEYEPVNVTRHYNFSPRVFVPGAAQFQKGQKVRGSLFISGEALFVCGAVTSEILCKTWEKELLSRNNNYLAEDISYFDNNIKTFRTIRNVCIGGAVAVYVWNIIDGIASKGKPHIVIGEASSVNFQPYADNMSSGLMMSINF